jgi:hypothetical protein
MITAFETLINLARRFEQMRNDAPTVNARRRAERNAKQLRWIALELHHGKRTTDDGWIWADAAAGQLIHDRGQLATLGRSNA